jgi:hypothetical protein
MITLRPRRDTAHKVKWGGWVVRRMLEENSDTDDEISTVSSWRMLSCLPSLVSLDQTDFPSALRKSLRKYL